MADIRVILDRLFLKRDGGNAEQQAIDVRQVNSAGQVIDGNSVSGAPTYTTVAAAVASTQIFAANASRKNGSVIWNDGTADMYIALGAAASATSYYYIIPAKVGTVPGSFFVPDGYTGVVNAAWSSATGNARCVEFA